ncbi:hypothetical protein D3C81_2285830 [compost metagenome]
MFLGKIKIFFAYDTHEDLEVINRLVALNLFIEAVENRMLVGNEVLVLEHQGGEAAH